MIIAVALMATGGAVLALDVTARSTTGLLGAIAVVGATLGWAIDNTLTRQLADRDPLQVIVAKGGLGALFTATIAIIHGEPMPELLWQVSCCSAAAQQATASACGSTCSHNAGSAPRAPDRFRGRAVRGRRDCLELR